VNTEIKIDQRAKDFEFLPVPYAPVRVAIKGDWRVHPSSLMVYSLNDVADGRTYTVTSRRAEPTAEQLQAAGEAPADIRNHYLGLTAEVLDSVRELAREHTRGAHTAYERAMKLQQWFTSSDFTYSLTARPPDNVNDLVDFLTKHRVGYCQQFAAAMAILARSLGIPARVAAGYTAGSQQQDGTWVVRSRDAHAWPELYFEGTGWVRFEPTPGAVALAGQGTATTPSYAEAATVGTGPSRGGQATPAPSSPAATTGQATPGVSPQQGGRLDERGGLTSAAPKRDTSLWIPVGWITGILLILLILAMPMGVRLAARHRRWARAARTADHEAEARAPARRTGLEAGPADPEEAAHAAWAEMRADAIDHGLPWRSSDSPRSAAHHLAGLLELTDPLTDPASAALHRIARAEERARYAPVPGPADTLRADVQIMRNVFAESVDRQARLRARFVPPTAMSTLRGAGNRSLDAFDKLAGRISALIHRS
jgi:transglutaminase-like putative cysteine protease